MGGSGIVLLLVLLLLPWRADSGRGVGLNPLNGRLSEVRRDPACMGAFALGDCRALDPGGVKRPERNAPVLLDLDGVWSPGVGFELSRVRRQLPHAAAAAIGNARGDAAISEIDGRDGKLLPS